MIIFPAIDIKGGKCVRLLKGDFAKITQYQKSPLDQAKEFSNLGFNNIHIVDLDGALKEIPVNESIIKEISKINKIKIQIGGGVRSEDHIKRLLDFGVDKIIIGTAAIEDINFLKIACEKFNNKIALSLDVRDGYIASSGWKIQTKILAKEFIKKIENIYGDNSHHIIESCFKGLARSLRQALEIDPRIKNKIPSTKGTL